MPGFILGTVGVMIGARAGRAPATYRNSARANTGRGLSARLLVQLVGVAAFASMGLGAFYLNGSYTYTDKETGLPSTMKGPQALRAAYDSLGGLTTDIHAAASTLWAQQQGKTWSEMWAELRAAFRDPAVEAREVLGLSADATAEEVKRAHRQLARVHHPDKVEPEKQEEAKVLMQKINWAKEVLVAKSA